MLVRTRFPKARPNIPALKSVAKISSEVNSQEPEKKPEIQIIDSPPVSLSNGEEVPSSKPLDSQQKPASNVEVIPRPLVLPKKANIPIGPRARFQKARPNVGLLAAKSKGGSQKNERQSEQDKEAKDKIVLLESSVDTNKAEKELEELKQEPSSPFLKDEKSDITKDEWSSLSTDTPTVGSGSTNLSQPQIEQSSLLTNEHEGMLKETPSEAVFGKEFSAEIVSIDEQTKERSPKSNKNLGIPVEKEFPQASVTSEKESTQTSSRVEIESTASVEEESHRVPFPAENELSPTSAIVEKDSSLTSTPLEKDSPQTAVPVIKSTDYPTLKSILNSPRKRLIPKKPRERRKRVTKFPDNPSRSEMTMVDLIYWNPSGTPLKATKTQNVIEELLPTDENAQPPPSEKEPAVEDEEEGSYSSAPKVIINEHGEIIIDESSLVVRRKDTIDKSVAAIVENENTTYASFRKNRKSLKQWTTKETTKFYKALSLVGTDFALMESIFSVDGKCTRTRRELKVKFKKEEKVNTKYVHRAMYESHTFDISILEEDRDDILGPDFDAPPKVRRKKKSPDTDTVAQPKKPRKKKLSDPNDNPSEEPEKDKSLGSDTEDEVPCKVTKKKKQANFDSDASEQSNNLNKENPGEDSDVEPVPRKRKRKLVLSDDGSIGFAEEFERGQNVSPIATPEAFRSKRRRKPVELPDFITQSEDIDHCVEEAEEISFIAEKNRKKYSPRIERVASEMDHDGSSASLLLNQATIIESVDNIDNDSQVVCVLQLENNNQDVLVSENEVQSVEVVPHRTGSENCEDEVQTIEVIPHRTDVKTPQNNPNRLTSPHISTIDNLLTVSGPTNLTLDDNLLTDAAVHEVVTTTSRRARKKVMPNLKTVDKRTVKMMGFASPSHSSFLTAPNSPYHPPPCDKSPHHPSSTDYTPAEDVCNESIELVHQKVRYTPSDDVYQKSIDSYKHNVIDTPYNDVCQESIDSSKVKYTYSRIQTPEKQTKTVNFASPLHSSPLIAPNSSNHLSSGDKRTHNPSPTQHTSSVKVRQNAIDSSNTKLSYTYNQLQTPQSQRLTYSSLQRAVFTPESLGMSSKSSNTSLQTSMSMAQKDPIKINVTPNRNLEQSPVIIFTKSETNENILHLFMVNNT